MQAQVFSCVDTAQLALVNRLNILTTPFKPPRLTNEAFNAGDVAFGKEYDDGVWMCFVRNNDLVIVHAPPNNAGDIAHEIDKAVQNAPVWQEGMPYPSFTLPQ